MIFARPSDDLISGATVSLASGTALSGYGVSQINVGSWALPLKISETAIDLRFDFGSAVAIAWAILGNTNLTVAATIQGHTADVWTSPDISVTFDIPTKSPRGLFTSPHVDLSAYAAKRYWRITATGNATPIVIGEVGLLSARRTITYGYRFEGTGFGVLGKSIRHETPYGVDLAYELHVVRDTIDGDIVGVEADRQAILDLLAATRFQARPFWMLPHDAWTDAWYVRYASDRLDLSPLSPELWRIGFPVQQLSRGLPWEAGV